MMLITKIRILTTISTMISTMLMIWITRWDTYKEAMNNWLFLFLLIVVVSMIGLIMTQLFFYKGGEEF